MRIMALDIGEKTIGIAISDPLGYTAQGIKTIRRKNIKADIIEIKNLITQYEIDEIIVGFPKNMNGTIGKKAKEVNKFIAILGKEINSFGTFKNPKDLCIKRWDERLTTVASEKILLEANISRKKRKNVLDKLAACLILQNYLDRYSLKHRQENVKNN